MANSWTQGDKPSADPERIEERLRGAGVAVDRSVSLLRDRKKCILNNHTDPSNHSRPTNIDGNYSIHGGRRLVIFDIDVPESELPEWVRNIPETFTVKTVHGGTHPYFILEDDTGISSTTGVEWGSIRYDGYYTVGPGSEIDHDYCDDGKDNCPGSGTGAYTIEVDKPIATLSGDSLANLKNVCGSDSGNSDTSDKEAYSGEKIILPDDHAVEEAEEYLFSEFLPRQAGPVMNSDLMDLLQGGEGSYDLRRENDPTSINRSATDYYALDGLYGAFLISKGESKEEAKRLALNLFKHFCIENPYDKTGNLRKWLQKGESYLTGEGVEWKGQIKAVEDGFNPGKWHKWRRKEHPDGFDPQDHKPWMNPQKAGKPGDIVADIVMAAISILNDGITDRNLLMTDYGISIPSDLNLEEYTNYLSETNCGEVCTPRGSTPAFDYSGSTADRIADLAHKLNPDRRKSYYKKRVLKQYLKTEDGRVAMAFCPDRPNGERYVYYHAADPDPDDARWVRWKGEEYEPGTRWSEEDNKKEEAEIMTDGGVNLPESDFDGWDDAGDREDPDIDSDGSESDERASDRETDRPPPDRSPSELHRVED